MQLHHQAAIICFHSSFSIPGLVGSIDHFERTGVNDVGGISDGEMASSTSKTVNHVVYYMILLLVTTACILQSASASTQNLPNCTFPAVYAFGDSLTDTGNSIAAFPDQFAHAELDPHGVLFPGHAADRYTDGKLLIDFLAFGVRQRPIYPVLRGTAGDFTYGTNFAAYGGPARSVKVWRRDSGFNSPFSLDVQHQWYERYKVRLWFYEDPIFHSPGLVQSLPKLATVNDSLFMVWSGYQDYFSSLYDATLTPRQTLHIVPHVVEAIEAHIQALLTPVLYTPPTRASLVMSTATTILVINLPPLGCIPALLSLYGGSAHAKFDSHGCLSDLNAISERHNELLGHKMDELRAKYPPARLLYGDAHGVYTDILKEPKKYNVTAPLKACCGVGGAYNFNKHVTCGHAGMVDNQFVNLTTSFCANPAAHLSWDGIHTSNTFNKAAVTAFLSGQHITPQGGLNCSPDFTFWDSHT